VFVSLGLGSVVASTLEVAPWLIAIGAQKSIIFPAVGVLLAFNYWLAVVRPRTLHCEPGEICHFDSPMSRFNRMLFWTSLGIYVVAVLATYGAEWWILQS
jgi:hypothetical protein